MWDVKESLKGKNEELESEKLEVARLRNIVAELKI